MVVLYYSRVSERNSVYVQSYLQCGKHYEILLHLESECIFAPVSVELVLDCEPILVALLHIRQHYLP